jgi:hypothetical protein
MKHALILLCLCLLGGKLQSQGTLELFNSYNTERDVKKSLRKSLHISDSAMHYSGDTLIVLARNDVQTAILKFLFVYEADIDEKYCQWQEILFDCNPCGQQYIDGVLHSKSYKFRKLADNRYLSSYFWKWELQVVQHNNSPYCLSLIVTTPTMSKREYKALHKTLPKLPAQ